MKKVYVLLLLVFGSLGVWGQVTLPHYEPINYTPPGPLQTQTGWTALNTGDDLVVAAGNLSFTGLPASTGNKVTFAGAGIDGAKLFTQQTTGTVYYSFLLDVTALGTLNTTGSYFTGFTEGTVNTFGATVWTRADGAGYDIGINPKTTAANTVWTTGTTSLNNTVFVVISYQLVAGALNDVVRLWINPIPGASEPSPTLSATNTVASDLANLNRILIRQSSATETPSIEMDELRIGTTWGDVTPAVSGTPNIIVTPGTLTGFASESGLPSAEQTYTVSGTDLTANIVITPPTGFEISATTGPFTPANPITLTPTAGTVPATTIYVRMNSATPGPNSGNISHVSAGSNNPNVAVSGNVIASEPTIQSSITIGAITNSTVFVNFGGGNGARRILLAKLASAVDSNPVDGTTYTANANFGSGSQIGTGNYVVYDGTGNSQLVTGLTAGATYHFAIYEYNDGGVSGAENYLVPGGVNNATVDTYSVPYVWVGLNGDWQVPTNWAPARLFPATNDSLLFTSASVNDIITNIPTQTVGYIGASLLTGTTFQAAANGNILTIGNLAGTDLFVEAGSSITINTANGLTLNLVTGATASINGTITYAGGAHRLIAADAGAVTFNNGGVFTAGTGFSGSAFGTSGTANSIVFASGSRYEQLAGSNPFGLTAPASLVVFNAGSLFKLMVNSTPSVSGRTYANFELDFVGATVSASGTGLLTMDNLTVTNGSITFGMTTAGFNLRGNINVATGGTLNFAPGATGVLHLVGTSAQSITNAGTLTFGVNQNVTINNAAGITLNSPVTLSGLLTLTNGVVYTSASSLLTMASTSSVTGATNASYVYGPMKKIGNTGFVFPVGKQNGLVPIEITGFVGGTASDEFTAEYIRQSAAALGPVNAGPGLVRVSGCDYWNLVKGLVTPTSLDVTAYWNANNPCGQPGSYITNLSTLTIAHFDDVPDEWTTYALTPSTTGTTAAGSITWQGATAFGPLALGSTSFGDNPLPITINYFNGARQNGNHLLNWKVTCVSSPSVTMELERSTDGRNYNSIYSLFATAVECQQPFNYTDASPAKGVNYYRLKMIDVDGKVTYSSIVPLINGTKGIEIMNIAPNPIVNGQFNLRMSTAEKMQVELVVVDMQGRVMMRQSTNTIAGFNTIPMNVQQLAKGTYQLFGNTADGKTKVLRFVVQ